MNRLQNTFKAETKYQSFFLSMVAFGVKTTKWTRRSKADPALVNGVNRVRKGKVNNYGKHYCII